MKTNNPQDKLDQLKRLCEAWPGLHPWQRKALLVRAYWLLIPRLKPPISFALRTTIAMFALLVILPVQPMTIPTAAGGGLAFALLTH